MRTFHGWVVDEYPDDLNENWKHLLWAGPLAATIGLGMHFGNKKKDVPVKPQAQVQHVQQAQTGPPDAKKIGDKKILVDDEPTTVQKTEPQKFTNLPQVSNRQDQDVGPGSEVKKPTGQLKSRRPIIKPSEDQPTPEPVKVVHDETPPTPEEIKISQGHPNVKAVKDANDKLVYRSIGSATVNGRDLNSAIKLARAVAVSNLMRQIQNKGVVRFGQGADRDVKIYTKAPKNGGVVVVFVVRDFNPDGVSVTPERDDEGLPRESTSHRSFQSYVSSRRKFRM